VSRTCYGFKFAVQFTVTSSGTLSLSPTMALTRNFSPTRAREPVDVLVIDSVRMPDPD
jgi:hypothetical protein